jgi:murein DD-endopeptidase MepM/ murein hydrolase activator NlpD
MAAAFGSGKDLLAGLGGVARVDQITGDAEKLQKIAEKRSVEADVAEERAAEAWAAVDAVPVEAAQAAVAEAERAVASARSDLSGLRTKVAATNVSFLDSLPRDAGQLSEQGWAPPVAGNQTDGFGPRPNKPLAGVNEFHRGTDVAASCGSPVFAATGGIVVEARANGTYGNWILLEHGEGIQTGYAHIQNGGIEVTVGETVNAGEEIARVGSTGAATGCHLHFETRIDGKAVDAVPFMARRGIRLG